MVPALMVETWRGDRRAVLGWAVGVAALTSMYTGFYQQFRGAAELKQDALPKGMLDFLGVPDLVSPASYLQATVFSLVGPLLVLMCAVTLAVRAVAGAEESGGLELLLTIPVSRTRFAVQRLASTWLAVTAVAAVPWLVLMAVVPAADIDVPLGNVTSACAGLVALAWCFTGIGFAVGAATGRRAAALAVTGGLAVATYAANGMAETAGGWRWLRWISPFHYFTGGDPLRTGWHPGQLAVLVGVAAVAAVAGVVWFDRRDVGV